MARSTSPRSTTTSGPAAADGAVWCDGGAVQADEGPSARPRRRAWPAACITIAAGACALILWRLDWGALGTFDAPHAWLLLLAAGLLHLLTVPLKTIAWCSTLAPALSGRPPAVGLVLGPVTVGALFNTVLAGRIGEAARVLLVHSRLNAADHVIALPAVIGSAVTESLVSAIAWVALVAGVGVVLPLPPAVWIVVGGLTAAWCAVLLAASRDWGAGGPARRADGVVGRALNAVRGVWISVVHGHRSLRRLDVLVPVVIASILGWVVQGASVYAVLRAFDLAGGWEAAALVLVSVTVAQTVPLLPGNVGVFQAAVALPLVGSFGVPVATALAVGIVLQLVQSAPVALAGAVSLARGGEDVRRVYRSARHLRHPSSIAAT